MDTLWIILGFVLIVVGLLGSVLPILPGPPIAYAGLLVQLFREPDPFTAKFLWIMAGVVVLSIILDWLIPIWGTKKYGGTKFGMWGCTIGFIVAFWMGPLGIIIGPFIGAFVGEMIGGRSTQQSFRAAKGSLLGFLFGSVLKIIVCVLMMYYLIKTI